MKFQAYLWVCRADCAKVVRGYKKDDKGYASSLSPFSRIVQEAEHPISNRPIYKSFPTLLAAEAWLRGDIPRGALVDAKLPDALRWDGVVLSESLMKVIKSRAEPRRPFKNTKMWNRQRQFSTCGPEAIDQELDAFHQTLRRLELARSRGYTTTPDGALVVYTDGSAVENGKKGCRAGSGVWWGRSGIARGL